MAIGEGGGVRGTFSVSAYMIELHTGNQTLFTELKKLAVVLRYVISKFVKMGVFHS